MIKFFNLLHLKFIYNINKFYFKLSSKIMQYSINRKIIFFSFKLFDLAIVIFRESQYDFSVLKRNLPRYFSFYKKLGFFKQILFIFFFFAGLIPVLLFICIFFFFLKYLFKYICVVMDFLFYPDDEVNYYYIAKYYLTEFFELIPLWVYKIYKFIFKSRWTLYFYKKFKNFLKRKRHQIFVYFVTKIDYFVFVYVPKKRYIIESYDYYGTYCKIMLFYYRTKRKTRKLLFWVIPWYVKNYMYRKYIKYIYNVFYIRIYVNIIRRNYRLHILWNYYLFRVFLLKTHQKCSDWYYYFFYIYKHIQYYWIWLYKVYFRSYACVMTIEAFFLVFYKNNRAFVIHFIPHIYYVIAYFIVYKIYELVKLHFERYFYWNRFLFNLKALKIRYKNEFYTSIVYYNYVFFHNIIILWWLSFQRADLLFDWNEECFYYDFTDKSITWWQMVLDNVVQLFFARAYWSTHYQYKFRFFSYVYHERFFWLCINVSERVIGEILLVFLWRKLWIKNKIIWCKEAPYYTKKYFADKRYYAKIFYYIDFKGSIMYKWKVFREWLRDTIIWLRNLELRDVIEWLRYLSQRLLNWFRNKIIWLRSLRLSDFIQWLKDFFQRLRDLRIRDILKWIRNQIYWFSELIYE